MARLLTVIPHHNPTLVLQIVAFPQSYSFLDSGHCFLLLFFTLLYTWLFFSEQISLETSSCSVRSLNPSAQGRKILCFWSDSKIQPLRTQYSQVCKKNFKELPRKSLRDRSQVQWMSTARHGQVLVGHRNLPQVEPGKKNRLFCGSLKRKIRGSSSQLLTKEAEARLMNTATIRRNERILIAVDTGVVITRRDRKVSYNDYTRQLSLSK